MRILDIPLPEERNVQVIYPEDVTGAEMGLVRGMLTDLKIYLEDCEKQEKERREKERWMGRIY